MMFPSNPQIFTSLITHQVNPIGALVPIVLDHDDLRPVEVKNLDYFILLSLDYILITPFGTVPEIALTTVTNLMFIF